MLRSLINADSLGELSMHLTAAILTQYTVLPLVADLNALI